LIIDGEDLPERAPLRARVVVVGAGPGGICLALELGRQGVDVLLVESGRLRPDAAIQALAEPASFDAKVHAPMHEATRRQLGGASVIWGGRCVPYDPVDFDARPHVPEGRWPIGYADVLPWFQRASDYCKTGRAVFDANEVATIRQKPIVPGLPDGDVRTTELERWSLPTDFGKVYKRELAASARVRVVHGLTVVEVVAREGGAAVDHLVARTLSGKTLRLEGDHHVIACGGVETTRLLLASDRRHAGGIGNHSGHLGRWYMGHISGRIARVHFTTPPERTAYGFERDEAGVYLRRRLTLTRECQQREGLTNIAGWLVNPTIGDPAHQNGVLSFAYLALTAPVIAKRFAPDAIRKSATKGAPPGAFWRHVKNVLADLPRTALFVPTFGWRRFVAKRRVPGFFEASADNRYDLHYHGEQVPRADSTITLVPEVDRLGLRKVALDLRYDARDVDAVLRVHRLWDAHLRRHGVGRLEWSEGDLAASVWSQAGDGFHQIGTTRMSAAPADGVVGPDCNVHGFADLHLVSSAVFPTSGQANSTYMIVVMALRLADHLARRLT